jgi:hypothetical protein
MFLAHLALLKAQYFFKKEASVESLKVLAQFNEHKLDMKVSLFKVTMWSNCKHVFELPMNCNLVMTYGPIWPLVLCYNIEILHVSGDFYSDDIRKH